MANIPQKVVHQYLRHDKKFPHVWCAGCSNGIVLGAIIRALASMNVNRDDVMMVSGIGCSSRMPVYIDLNTCTPCMAGRLPLLQGLSCKNRT